MSTRLQRALFVLLLCILPVQSMAAALGALLCPPGDRQHDPAVMTHEHDHASAGHAHHQHTQTGDQAGDPAGGHLCCHAALSGMTSVHPVFAPHDFRTYATAISPQPSLFVPEQPRRPPRV